MPDSRVTGGNLRGVCGPFPRSLWTHPYSPEDDFDRLCAEIWKRAERTKKGMWSYSLDYCSLFNNDQTAETAKGLERYVIARVSLERLVKAAFICCRPRSVIVSLVGETS